MPGSNAPLLFQIVFAPADKPVMQALLVVLAVGVLVAATTLLRSAWIRHRREQRQRELMRKWIAMNTQLSAATAGGRRSIEGARVEPQTSVGRY